MNQSLGQVAIVVRDYDEALSFYVGTLGFELIEDTPVPEQNKRWVVVAPASISCMRQAGELYSPAPVCTAAVDLCLRLLGTDAVCLRLRRLITAFVLQ